MKEIKITNGVVTLKEFCSRRLKKEITNAITSGADVKTVGGKQEISGISIQSMERANDIALVGMTESIVINGENITPSADVYDDMNIADVKKVLEEVNKITSPETIPNA